MDFENEPDRPMRDDIRLLGRLLGDTVRDQEGSASFELVEHVRQSAIAFHRDENVEARRELERILDGLSREQTMVVARAFSYFSHLANLAEDLHNSRRRRQADIDGEPPADGSLAKSLDRIAASGIDRGSAVRVLPRRRGRPGADRAPDRGPAQERARPGDAARAAAAGPRTHSPHATGTRSQRRIDPSRRAGAVADPHAAAREARRARRGRERPVVLRADLPARGAGALRRPRGRTAAAVTRTGRLPRCPRSCASARGSAATATAIRSSPQTCWNARCACSRHACSSTTSSNCTCSAPNSR